VDKAEELLETVISADEEDWDNVLRTGLDLGGGPVQSQELFKALQRRVERTLMRTVSSHHLYPCSSLSQDFHLPHLHQFSLRFI
jgi:hypothetical protein